MNPRFAEVAIPIPVHHAFTYDVPEALRPLVTIGVRVLVPFGPRRITGFVVGTPSEPTPGVDTKPIADVLDAEPLFGDEMLRFFRWIAAYYHDSLGEVIRTALPAGLAAEDVRVVTGTDAGRARLGQVLDGLDGRDRAALLALEAAPPLGLPVAALLAAARLPAGRLAELHRAGLVDVTYQLADARTKPRIEPFAVFVAEPDKPPVSDKEARVLDAIREGGPAGEPVSVRELNRRFRSVKANLERLASSGAVRVEERRVYRDPPGPGDAGGDASAVPPELTPEQVPVVDRVVRALDEGYAGFLLHGVTGSGKTEVYLRLIAGALERERGAIVLVPEIALTPQLVARFRARFGSSIAVLHSGLSDGERVDQWVRIGRGELVVVIGARSAIFAPVPRLGIIVVDEEHETSFKQEDRPRYHARDLALVRGHLAGCPVVLGSATPSLETHHLALTGRLERLSMKSRALDRPLPIVTVVDLRHTGRVGPHQSMSVPLADAMAQTLERGEQAILFLNRRGYSSFVVCDACEHIPECRSCSITLSASRASGTLRCHYCGFETRWLPRCPECQLGALSPIGVGTERVEEDVRALFPGVAVARMDRDTTRGKALFDLLSAFRSGEIRVLIGTQMVAKGHDFPGVTLVGVLLADQGLKFPDFRAAERTFQLLTQVAGRAGRGDRKGRVLVQTYDPGHYSLVAAQTHDYDGFVASELPVRRLCDYPPFSYLAMVKVTESDEVRAEGLAASLAAELRDLALRPDEATPSTWVLGPAWAPIQKIKNKVRAQILLKARHRQELHRLLAWLARTISERNLAGTVGVDVDPVNLL